MTPNFTDPKGLETVLGEAVDLQIWICCHEHTVDGQNPAPPGMVKTLYI